MIGIKCLRSARVQPRVAHLIVRRQIPENLVSARSMNTRLPARNENSARGAQALRQMRSTRHGVRVNWVSALRAVASR